MACKLNPKHAFCLYVRGKIYRNLDEFPTHNGVNHALKDLARSIELDPSSASTYKERQNCYLILGNNKDPKIAQKYFKLARADGERADKLKKAFTRE
jgi:hypothetical protein